MDILKYLKNKDVKVANEDFDIEGMEKEIRNGYVEKSTVPDLTKYVAKDDLTKLQGSYTELETNYNDTIKKLNDTNTKMQELSLQNKMISRGFKEEDFGEVAKIRASLYADEKDDKKAIDLIAEKFKATYFKEEPKPNTPTPNTNSLPLNNNNGGNNAGKDIKITRKTSVRDMIISQ